MPFSYEALPPLERLQHEGYRIIALEQTEVSQRLQHYSPVDKIALLIGEEVEGITADLLAACDDFIEIDMVGQKESFNVSVATGIALYALTTSK